MAFLASGSRQDLNPLESTTLTRLTRLTQLSVLPTLDDEGERIDLARVAELMARPPLVAPAPDPTFKLPLPDRIART